jgi:hypothetical protein
MTLCASSYLVSTALLVLHKIMHTSTRMLCLLEYYTRYGTWLRLLLSVLESITLLILYQNGTDRS